MEEWRPVFSPRMQLSFPSQTDKHYPGCRWKHCNRGWVAALAWGRLSGELPNSQRNSKSRGGSQGCFCFEVLLVLRIGTLGDCDVPWMICLATQPSADIATSLLVVAAAFGRCSRAGANRSWAAALANSCSDHRATAATVVRAKPERFLNIKKKNVEQQSVDVGEEKCQHLDTDFEMQHSWCFFWLSHK